LLALLPYRLVRHPNTREHWSVAFCKANATGTVPHDQTKHAAFVPGDKTSEAKELQQTADKTKTSSSEQR